MPEHAPADEPFLWGVATSAYQSEGGYNGPGQPQTNWAAAERRGEVAPIGRAVEFWSYYKEDFARCQAMGLNAVRMGLEWSRIQPSSTEEKLATSPAFDYGALDHYAEMLATARRNQLEPVVTLHHFVHPAWLGPDAWLDAQTPELFARYVAVAVSYVNQKLADSYDCKPVRYYITINEPNMLVVNSYFGTQFPSGSPAGIPKVLKAYNQLLCAHVIAYNLIHDTYEAQGWAKPMVTLNNYCSDHYWSDKALLDLLSSRARGIMRAEIPAYINSKAREFYAALREERLPLHKDLAYVFGKLGKAIVDWLGRRSFTAPGAFDTLLDTLFNSPRAKVLDYIGLDYYDPFVAHVFRLPVWWDHEFRNRSLRAWVMNTITSKWWDWRVLPRGLHFFCRYYHQELNLPVLIAENGMALRRPPGDRNIRRKDQISRSQFLGLHLQEVERIVREGIPLLGYLHWSLFDNYEWGTYTPRFGLFSISYRHGMTRLVEDPSGDRPSETYAQLIREARSRAAESQPLAKGLRMSPTPQKSL